jgi:outer membrane protein
MRWVVSPIRKGLAGVLAVSAALLTISPASAETILGALAKAYGNNSSLNSARAGVRVTDEDVAIAKSGYRPVIRGSSSWTRSQAAAGGVSVGLTSGSFGVEISQTIFDGFQTLNNVRAAEARVRASNESLRNTEQNTLFDAAAAYMDVIRDREIASLRERNLEFLAEQVRAANSRLEVGEGTRTDVAQAEASRQAAIAQLAGARAQVLASSAQYRQIVGEDPGRLEGTSPLARLVPRSIEESFAIAGREHPAVIASEHFIDAAGFSVKSSEGALLPQLSAGASIGKSFRDSTAPSAANPNGWSDSASIGATLTVPIYQGGRVSATVRKSKESLGQARIDADVNRDRVRQAVAAAWAQYIAAQETVSAGRELVSAARLALNGVTEERNVGQRTTLDVLNAQADVTDAQINLVSAQRDVVVASYAILSAIGRLSAPQLGLNVAVYHPEEHFNAVKDKWFGLRTPDGR